MSNPKTRNERGEIMGEVLNFDSVIDAEYEKPAEVVTAGTVLDLDVIRPKIEDFKREAVRIAADAGELTVVDQDSLNRAVVLGGSAKTIAAKVEAQRKAAIADPQDFIDTVNRICTMVTDMLVTKKNSKKEITNPDCAENLLKTKIGQHQAKVELERREAERRAREAIEALQRKLQDEADEANRKAQEEARRRVEEEQRIKREKEEAEARERGAKKAELERLAKKAEEERLEALRKAEEEAKKIEVVAPTVVAPVVQEAPRVIRTEAGSSSQRKVWTFEIMDRTLVPILYLKINEQAIRDAIKMVVRHIPGVRIFEDTKTVFRT